jgi:uncharacterized protein YerC
MYPYMSKPQTEANVHIPDEILRELLTASEIRMLKNRFQIIKLLEEGLSVRAIASQVKVGTDTVVRVSRMTERANLRKVLSKSSSNPRTSWVFGKSKE